MEQERREIEESERDIDSLSKEIETLEDIYNKLLHEAKSCGEDDIDSQNENNKDNTYKDIPQILQHNHIVGPLNLYFSSNNEDDLSDDEIQVKKRKLDLITSRKKDDLEVKENILYENIYRLGGISAFPINEYLFKGEEELLGLRFDIMSHLQNKYLTPHYVILRKIATLDKTENISYNWTVYRHTLPAYVPLIDISKKLTEDDSGILAFTKEIRQFLLKIQYKHDKFDSITKLKYNNFGINSDKGLIRKINRDLMCQKLTIYVTNRLTGKGYHTIDVICTDSNIQTVAIKAETSFGSKEDIIYCENMLRNCSMNNLVKTFRKVFNYLIQKSII